MRKEALRLLGCLMLHNPFGPALPADRFDASLAIHKAMLEAVMPSEGAMGADDMTQSVQVDSVGEHQESAKKGDKGEEEEEEGDGMDIDSEEEEAEVANEEEKPAESATAVPAGPAAKTPAEVGWDGTVEELQALVASLELAVEFARSLAGCSF